MGQIGLFLGILALGLAKNAAGIEAGSASLESPEDPGLNGLVSDMESGESWSSSLATWTEERGGGRTLCPELMTTRAASLSAWKNRFFRFKSNSRIC